MFNGSLGATLALVGGVALFLLGMELLGEGLQRTAGSRVRDLLARLTRNRWQAAGGGVLASTLIHSGPTTVIVLGFVNAGLLSLSQAIPLVFGANIGTTLSMQIVAFNVGKYAYAVVALGLLMRQRKVLRDFSLVPIGFGLLFVGLETMKAAFAPLRDSPALLDAIALFDTHTAGGFLLALAAGTVLTVVFQSSGVIISLLFSLAALGLVDDFHLAIPFILGAHIGTCSMTLLAAPGGTATAWRTAWAHVLFNLVGAGLATAMLPLYDWLIPRTSDDVTRQIANFNTAKQAINVVLLLPLAPVFEKVLLRLTSRIGAADEERCHLDTALVATPEAAILAVVREMRRQASIVERMLRTSLDGMVSLDMRKFRAVASQEHAVDVIKHQINAYIARIAQRSLEPRQTLMLQRLVVASSAIERIGDHVEDIGFLSRQRVAMDIWFEDEHMNRLLEMSGLVCEMLDTAREAIDPTRDGSRELAEKTLEQRAKYKKASRELKETMRAWIESGEGDATTTLYFMRYQTIMDKIVSHLKALAREERDETYTVLDSGLARVEPLAPKPAGRPRNHPIHATFEEALRDLPPREATQ